MILITGGAGYIGSHTNKMFKELKYETVVVDDLSTGNIDFVKEYIHTTIADPELSSVFRWNKIDAVIHFAASIDVEESITDPKKYYENNFVNTLKLLNMMMKHNVKNIVFSSTAAVYGIPWIIPIKEESPCKPVNPYGWSKLLAERVIQDYHKAYGLNYVILRYFNAAGADVDCEVGERRLNETHLIPLLFDVASGKREEIKIFGTDYNTDDGTCVRDYIHVEDLAEAHLMAYERLRAGGESGIFNLGNSVGFSVREVIRSVKRVTGKKIKVVETVRREGDPDILISDSTKAMKQLGWIPDHTELDDIVKSAWLWYQKDHEGR